MLQHLWSGHNPLPALPPPQVAYLDGVDVGLVGLSPTKFISKNATFVASPILYILRVLP
jgi:hypothetical protein